jgi:hypothetical protein
MSDKVSGGANSRSSLRVILRKTPTEHIWSGLPQIATVKQPSRNRRSVPGADMVREGVRG